MHITQRATAPPNSAAIPLPADWLPHAQMIDIDGILTQLPFWVAWTRFSLLAGNVMDQLVLWEKTPSA
jgi:hypothetical protein